MLSRLAGRAVATVAVAALAFGASEASASSKAASIVSCPEQYAMNHILASPTTNQVDLSRADFEQHGSDADIDNPFVPNMIGLIGGVGHFGRGFAI